MLNKTNLKIFAVVFISAFAANTAITYLWDMWFHDAPARFDVSSATAVAVAIAVVLTAFFSRNRTRGDSSHSNDE
jgi:hypothetical protein